MDDLAHDLRDGWRGIRRQPAFAAAAVLMLSLGIGASSAIFTVVQAVVLKMPFEDPDRIVFVRAWRRADGAFVQTSYDRYLEWRRADDVFEAAGAFSLESPVADGPDGVVRLSAEVVSRSLFDVLGVQPILGRTFTDDEDRPGGPPVVVLSHRHWRSAFGGDPAVLGRHLVLDDVPVTIVGVMPEGFEGPRSRDSVQAWLPIAARRPAAQGRSAVSVYGRLKAGVTQDAARARLEGIAGGDVRVDLSSLLDDPLYSESSSQLRVLAGAVGLLLVMACVNVASLLVGRNVTRRRELAVRLSLGASRGHIIRQLVAESLMISVTAAAAGLLLAWWAVAAIVPLIPGTVPRVEQMRVDLGVVAFAALTAGVTGLAVSLWPAWSASRVSLVDAMSSGGRGMAGGARRARTALIVAESALAMTVLSAAALMVGSFLRLNPTDPGFELADRSSFMVRLEGARYLDTASRRAAAEHLAERLRAIPGVMTVSAASALPLTNSTVVFPVRIQGALPGSGRPPTVHHRAALPRFLTQLGMPILRGRDLDDRDGAGAEPTAVVNEAFARRLLAGREPLGASLEIDESDGTVVRRVVGVVRDARIFGSDLQPRPEVYVPYAQAPFRLLYFVVHAEGAVQDLQSQIRMVVRSMDAGLPLNRVQTLRALAADSVDLPRFLAMLMGVFAAVGLLLASIGLYAVAAWSVAQRTREIGVRMALGARPADIRRMVLRYGAAVGTTGAVIGSAAALASARVLETWLFGLPARQPALLLALGATFIVLITAACYMPARRAMRIDPMAALRLD